MSDHDRPDHVPADAGPRFLQVPPLSEDFEERGTPEQLAALYGALAAASVEFAPIVKDREVTIHGKSKDGRPIEYTYSYAPLENLIDATRPALGRNGLFVSQPFTRVLAENVGRVRTRISHAGGACLVFTLEFIPEGDIKEIGAKTTYSRRYAYQCALGLDAGEMDADTQPIRAGETGAEVRQKNRQPPAPQKAASKPAPKADSPRPTPAQRQVELERTLSTPAFGNGSGAPEGDPGPEPPEDLEPRVEYEVTADIRAMDDDALGKAIRSAATALFKTVDSAQTRCLQITGLPKGELDRAGLELLLAGFRADIAAQ
jgi:hypothetical protein